MNSSNGTVRQLVDELDHQTRRTPVPTNEMKPPAYGGPQRDAIGSIVDGVVSDICASIAALRHELDDIEQQLLESGAGIKHGLHSHVALCGKLKDEVSRVQATVESIKAASKGI
jgi:hypothetical protein